MLKEVQQQTLEEELKVEQMEMLPLMVKEKQELMLREQQQLTLKKVLNLFLNMNNSKLTMMIKKKHNLKMLTVCKQMVHLMLQLMKLSHYPYTQIDFDEVFK